MPNQTRCLLILLASVAVAVALPVGPQNGFRDVNAFRTTVETAKCCCLYDATIHHCIRSALDDRCVCGYRVHRFYCRSPVRCVHGLAPAPKITTPPAPSLATGSAPAQHKQLFFEEIRDRMSNPTRFSRDLAATTKHDVSTPCFLHLMLLCLLVSGASCLLLSVQCYRCREAFLLHSLAIC